MHSGGELYKLKNSAKTQVVGNVYATAATGDNVKAILISNYNSDEEETGVEVNNLCDKYTASVFYCTEEKHLTKEVSFDVSNETKIEILLPKQTVVLIKFEEKNDI